MNKTRTKKQHGTEYSTLIVALAVLALMVILATQYNSPTPDDLRQTPTAVARNTGGFAFFTTQDFSDAVLSQRFAVPWDVFHSNTLVLSTQPENLTVDEKQIRVRIAHPVNNAVQLTYKEVYVRNAQTQQWKKFTIGNGKASPYQNFKEGPVYIDIDAAEFGVGENYVAAYFCTEETNGNILCGCSGTNKNTCGKWNLQRVSATGIYGVTQDVHAPVATINRPSANGATVGEPRPEIGFIITDDTDRAIEYQLYVDGFADTGATGSAQNGTNTSVNLSLLTAETHTIIVQAKDDAGNLGNSSPITIIVNYVDNNPPSTPTNVRVTATTNTSVTLAWSPSTDDMTGVAHYRVFRNNANVANISAPNTGYTDSGLTQLTTYTYHVTAVDGVGRESGASSSVSATTTANGVADNTKPGATISSPTQGAMLSDNTPDITFTLTDNLATTIDYVIYRNSTIVLSGSGQSNQAISRTLPAITPDGPYALRVQATDNANNTNNSSPVLVTIDTVPPVLSNNKTSGVTANQAIIEVTTNEWAQCRYSNTTSTYANMQDFDIATTTVTTYSATVTGLSPSTQQTYFIRCKDEAGNSDTHNPVTTVWFTTSAAPQPPPAPGNPTATTQTSSSILVGWNTVSGAVSYNIGRATSSTGTYTTVRTGEVGMSYLDTGLTPSTTYYYKVAAVNANGVSWSVSPVSATTSASCTPESDSQFCSRLTKTCGQFTGTDNCNTARTANCGVCGGGQTCTAQNVCASPATISVTAVSSPTANGAYKEGQPIDVSVTFSGIVTVTGSPALALETGTTDRTAVYQSGSGSTTLIFRYIPILGDAATDLDYQSTAAIQLTTATIKDGAGNAAALTLPAPGAAGSLGAAKNIIIDTSTPTISAVTVTNATLSFTVSWTTNEATNETINYGQTASLGTLVSNSAQSTSHNRQITVSSAGTYYGNITACDLVGHCTQSGPHSATPIASVPQDTAPPTVTFTAPTNNVVLAATTSTTLTVTTNEPATCKYSGSDISFASMIAFPTTGGTTHTATTSVVAGSNSRYVRCQDTNGNVMPTSASVTFTVASCGNSQTETGEQCDLGSANGLCCTSSCQFASVSTVCNAATGVCDQAEHCTGNSATCPANAFKAAGTTCGSPATCTTAPVCSGSSATCPATGTAITPCCGNSVVEGTEQCDGTNFGGESCVTYGYASGSLTCTNACITKFSSCIDCPGSSQTECTVCGGTWSCPKGSLCSCNYIA